MCVMTKALEIHKDKDESDDSAVSDQINEGDSSPFNQPTVLSRYARQVVVRRRPGFAAGFAVGSVTSNNHHTYPYPYPYYPYPYYYPPYYYG